MRRLIVTAALVLLGSAAPVPLSAQGSGRIAYQTYTLPNGLRVVFSEDHSTPIVTVNVWYRVGSANERARRSGFAHLFEHMMFQGSAHVRKGEHFQLVERAGGSMNGYTTEDRTAYFETLPSNRLNLGLWLESDRMRSLAVTAENFENQRQTVKEERRLGVDNQPYARAVLDGFTLPFDSSACFAYAHTVIGDMADLDSARVEDVQEFFRQYYAPNNATLTVVGDFDPAEARRLIEQYFGDVPRVADPAPVACRVSYGGDTGDTGGAGGAGGRRVETTDRNANLPAVIVLYKVPPLRDADIPALSLLASILGSGESSRLNRRVVREERAALQSASFPNLRRGPGLLGFFAIANQGVEPARLESLLAEEMARAASDTIPEAELAKARNRHRAGLIRERQTTFGVAEAIQEAAYLADSLDSVNQEIERYAAVTIADLRRVAARYLASENRLTLVINPPAREAREAREGGN